jgi:hypothetical protein
LADGAAESRQPPNARRPSAVANTYEKLTPKDPNRNRNLRSLRARNQGAKETIMLDFVFVALGCVLVALMGVYALALRQL